MQIDCSHIIGICDQFLKFHDPRLIDHGERVAYIANKILKYLETEERLNEKTLTLLALFHDIGAYKTEEIDRMVSFESNDVERHSIYGYVFIKYFTTLTPYAEVVLYHHTPHSELKTVPSKIRLYAEILRLADRVDVGFENGMMAEDIFTGVQEMDFDPICLDALENALEAENLFPSYPSSEISRWLEETLAVMDISQAEALRFLEMMICTIDFKSETTALHSTNTVIISLFLGEKLGLSEDDLEKLRYASLIHDIGKIAVPTEILEYPGKLSPEQMEIMKQHVVYTLDIIKGILPEDIVSIATRHHEKLDGSGYPYGLKGDDLSPCDRILAIADIVSALGSSRSYKNAYSWEKLSSILLDMANKNLIDPSIAKLVCDNSDELEAVIREKTKPVLAIYKEIHHLYDSMLLSSL